MLPNLVLVRGGGDLASGVIYRIFRSGINVIVIEKEKPTSIRRGVAFAQAAYDGYTEVEGIACKKVTKTANSENEGKVGDVSKDVWEIINEGNIPLLIDPTLAFLDELNPEVLIEATMGKKNIDVNRDMAKKVIALGPGYTAGSDVDAVVETTRGHYLGRVIYNGKARPNTKIAGEIGGYAEERILRAPIEGTFKSSHQIGDQITEGEIVGYINDTPMKAKISGVLRGLLQNKLKIKKDLKVADIDPRAVREFCFTISDKALAIGGGTLEGILAD